MAYTKTTWVNGETPINANNLNKIENQLETLTNLQDQLNESIKGISEIVENNNGTAIKYSNGIMICYGSSSGTSTTSNFYQYLYRLAENLIINFPATFSGIPVVTLTPDYINGMFACPINAITVSQIKFTPIKAGNSGNSYTVHYVAIGKWK